MTRRWDFGSYKLHPLWSNRDEEELRLRPGDVLFRGTTTVFLRGKEVRAHPEGGRPGRIYLSEGEEDAGGYAYIVREQHGGDPVLVQVAIDDDLFRRLKPGREGLGEWYVEATAVPVSRVGRLPKREERWDGRFPQSVKAKATRKKDDEWIVVEHPAGAKTADTPWATPLAAATTVHFGEKKLVEWRIVDMDSLAATPSGPYATKEEAIADFRRVQKLYGGSEPYTNLAICPTYKYEHAVLNPYVRGWEEAFYPEFVRVGSRGIRPRVARPIRRTRGPGPGWWREPDRHARAARRGWRGRR